MMTCHHFHSSSPGDFDLIGDVEPTPQVVIASAGWRTREARKVDDLLSCSKCAALHGQVGKHDQPTTQNHAT